MQDVKPNAHSNIVKRPLPRKEGLGEK